MNSGHVAKASLSPKNGLRIVFGRETPKNAKRIVSAIRPRSYRRTGKVTAVSHYQKTVAARERAQRIREVRTAVLARLTKREDAATIREYLKHGTDGGVS